MKIIYFCTCYNEIEYLPYVIDYYLAEGIEVYVIDNYSTDGTWEWLEKRNIPRERVDTQGSFYLDKLQAAKIAVAKRLQPDWIVHGDADEFIIGIEKPIDQLIYEVDKAEFNCIKCRKFEFYNTGEERPKGDPRNHFFYYEESSKHTQGIIRVHKYHPEVKYLGDVVFLPQMKLCSVNAFILNYGATKSVENRKEILERKKKAWAMGMHPALGSHYLEHEKKQWLWDKKELLDIRSFEPLRGHLGE